MENRVPAAALLLAAVLVVATATVYAPTLRFGFIALDDPGYVASNPHVLGGPTPSGIAWAFTTTTQANWHPLTWVSLQIDAVLGGGNAWAFHLTNVVLHTLNTLLVFWLLFRGSDSTWRSWFVAAVFALHPLHVESVAWVSERKDVLSTFFGLLAILAYGRYAVRPSVARMALVACAHAASLLSKPMLVTLPALLLLLDVWPLGRAKRETIGRLVGEKIPLAVLSVASAVVTWTVQSACGATVALERVSLGTRAANAMISIAAYLGQTVWPRDLAVFYPLDPESIAGWRVAGAVLLVVAVSAGVSISRRRSLAVGWGWFLLALLPVLGIVQAGSQSRADRYTYVPMIGLGILAAWGVRELVGSVRALAPRKRSAVLRAAAVALACVLMIPARNQVGLWKDTTTLLSHTLRVTRNNAPAHMGLGLEALGAGRTEEAIHHLTEAVRIAPGYPEARMNLGAALVRAGEDTGAIAQYREAIRLGRDSKEIRATLAGLLARQGDFRQAAAEMERAIALGSPDAKIRVELGALYLKSGDLDAAEVELREALRLRPDFAPAHTNLGVVLARKGRGDQALTHFEEAVRLDPTDEGARKNLERARRMPGS